MNKISIKYQLTLSLTTLLLLFTTSACTGLTSRYPAEAIKTHEGWVIDAESKAPLQGVIVVVQGRLDEKHPLPGHVYIPVIYETA